MHDTARLLDAAKHRQGIPNDYKLGLTLGVVPSAVKNYRAGRSFPDDAVAARLADLAGLDAGYVLACVHAERSKSAEVRSLWEALAKKLERAGAVALAVLAVILSTWTGGPDAGAMAATPQNRAIAGSEAGSTVHYVKLLLRILGARLGRSLRRLMALLGDRAGPNRGLALG